MKKNELVLPHNWAPRPYQQKLWNFLEHGGKRAIALWHRRAGKDDVALQWAAVAAMQRPGSYWHLLPEYSQARKAIWTAVNPHTGKRRIDEAFPQAIRENTLEQEMFIRLKNGATWQVVGSDTYSSLVGTPPAGIVFSEWSRANPASWAYLAPILVENGGWALFITTPLGRNHALSMLEVARSDPRWFSEILTVEDSGAISLDAVEQQRKEYHSLFGIDAGDALIQQEYYCSFAAPILGAYYAREMNAADHEGRICKIDIDPDKPILTAWDLGIDDPTAIWVFQVEPGRVNVIDYYESSGYGLGHYVEWLSDNGYRGGVDYVPHDARQRDWGSGRARLEVMIEKGRNPKVVQSHSLMDGISAGRQTIPLAYFDATRCAKGLECLRAYAAEWDENARTFKKSPAHNWASHGADAFRYLALSWREPITQDREPSINDKIAEMIRPKTLNEVLEQYDDEQREEDPDYRPYHEAAL
jgi:phage terminase large subunit